MLKSLKIFCIVIMLMSCMFPTYAQERAQGNVYQIMPYNVDFVKLKHRVFRDIKLTREAKKLNANGLLSAEVHLDEAYKSVSVRSNSNVGYGIDDALVHAIEKNNGSKGRDYSKMKELVTDHKLTFDVPFYVFDRQQTTMVAAPVAMGGGVGFGIGVPVSNNKDFVMVADFYHQNATDSLYDFSRIFPQGSFQEYVAHFASAYTERKTKGSFSPGQYVVTFKVDHTGRLKDIRTLNVHQKNNTISRFLRRNEEVFALNPITTAGGQPMEIECVMVFSFYNKTGLF